MAIGPLAAYRAWLAEGRIRPDPMQELAAEKLESLYHGLLDYRPASGQAGWRARFGLTRRRDEPPPPQGLYIYGAVGRGKSMLMDMFFDQIPMDSKRRVHFHEFMLQVHARIHEWRRRKSQSDADPIPPLAREIATSAWLLCFDEFQVQDIADAMILGRLFEALFALGVVVVATSNRHPDELYKDGLQRDRFLPFITLFKQRLDILALNGDTDYRLKRLMGIPVYYTPLDKAARQRMDEAFRRLTEGETPRPCRLALAGRSLEVPLGAAGVARYGFADLCERPLGAADFLTLATHFHTLLIDDVPIMGPDSRNQAKRFVTLIDALYEHKVHLLISAAAPPDQLYAAGDGSFEFERTVSRLMEMQSAGYMSGPHLT